MLQSKLDKFLPVTLTILVIVILSYPMWSKTSVTFDVNSQYPISIHDDRDNKGNSQAVWIKNSPEENLEWTCDIKKGVQYPYCTLMFNTETENKGIDLSMMRSVTFDYEYSGDLKDTISIVLHTNIPDISNPDRPWETLTYTMLEFRPSRYPSPAEFDLVDFKIPQWWLSQWDLTLEQSRVNLTDIRYMEVVLGKDPLPEVRKLKINSLTFHGRIISEALFYEIMVAILISLLFMRVLKQLYNLRRAYLSQSSLAEKLTNQVKYDPLTQIYNRHAFDECCHIAENEWSEKKILYSLIMIDIDHFKSVNDLHGHSVGDEVLVQLAQMLKCNSRETDTVARWGGEEFMMLLPETNAARAVKVAEKIRRIIIETSWPNDLKITASFGVAMAQEFEATKDLFNRTDAALYKAKREGRNIVALSIDNQTIIG